MTVPQHSLIEALTEARIPVDNHAFVWRLVTAVGISGYRPVDASEPYVLATRADGERDLRIYWGYTTGFPTEEEASRLGKELGAETGRSGKLPGTWYVGHPLNRGLGPRVGSVHRRQRAVTICKEGCGQELPVAGVCDNCE